MSYSNLYKSHLTICKRITQQQSFFFYGFLSNCSRYTVSFGPPLFDDIFLFEDCLTWTRSAKSLNISFTFKPFLAETKKWLAPTDFAYFSASSFDTFLDVYKSALFPTIVSTIPLGALSSSSVIHFLTFWKL